ncbi:glycine betaine ABC transporter substrate-binding protein [Oceanobacillus profundus]|uniref:Glycine/betaine ABC transporter n=1 Tax=Oceanobacillus profundus TaxID=372463 RepID=A0A417YB96_9BACI|nr:glycine betaine ABC transporter substrate-binding protein [Oceanobacillus profundus]MBR3121411.1 glycine/betaine ABC transporter [Oceanobacillus sp.]MCM3399980.1 glycine/betaine ABC transporter [Oceanobacillus profundus]MDO6450403.1 glycine betaine ABC transporter substrate-binding protein [Oceanobacillus profundus]RHW29865.1 glycine/betaine ABC transporter [Oceanobacillus profundus]
MKQIVKKGIAFISISILMILAACQGEAGDNNSEEDNAAADISEIVGIEPGSGTMTIAEETVEAYDLDLDLLPSTEPAMITELQTALENEEPIVVTLWQPHWMFSEYDLKFLKDPQGTLGESENIHTMVRQGLEEEHPSAYKLLDNFYWEVPDMNEVMAKFGQNEDVEPREAAEEWIADNRDKVDAWTEGIDTVENETIELAYVNWDTELSSTNVVALVLEELGYTVELTPLDMGIAFESLSVGEVDGMLIAWLPVGAASYAEQYKDEIVDLGPSLEGAQQGFVVPEYMDIDSIEDLPTK